MPGHHLANSAGIVYEHMIIAEELLHRQLRKGEVVHHEDRNRSNNDPDNIMVFKTNRDHSAYHKGCEIYLDGDVYCAKTLGVHVKATFKNQCPICGNLKTYDAQLCLDCYKAAKRSHIPTQEELRQSLLTLPMTQIGNKYGVSDNAVRKWCKKYDLPFKRDDIEQFRIAHQNKIEVF